MRNLKTYCDKVTDESETVIVTRKGRKMQFLLVLKNGMLCKKQEMLSIFAMLDRSIEQLSSGNGQSHELIEVDDE